MIRLRLKFSSSFINFPMIFSLISKYSLMMTKFSYLDSNTNESSDTSCLIPAIIFEENFMLISFSWKFDITYTVIWLHTMRCFNIFVSSSIFFANWSTYVPSQFFAGTTSSVFCFYLQWWWWIWLWWSCSHTVIFILKNLIIWIHNLVQICIVPQISK